MNSSHRRTFLKNIGLGAAAWTAGGKTVGAESNERVVVGVIGPGGMGSSHVRLLAARTDVEIASLCDVDQQRLAKGVAMVESATGKKPDAVRDLRHLLENDRIDAVFIATPDHWHAPAAILALDAGKHVYVEKPCCHNIREGRLMADAVQRNGKCLQVGTQSRSTDCVREAIERVHEGQIGDVLVAKAWNSQRRSSIGKTKPSNPPEYLDFDLWLGPAPVAAYRSNMLPSIWRWWYDYGCGDVGNDGVHDIDVALWGLGVATHPSTAACLGGKYFFDDDQQFPDTQYAIFEYGDGCRSKQLIYEQRIWSPYAQDGYANGAAFYGTKGVMIVGHTRGWRLYGERNRLVAQRDGPVDLKAHHDDFLDVVRGRKQATNADVLAGHRAATIVHLANISARTGRTLQFDPQSEQILEDPEAAAMVGRHYREGHWAVPKEIRA
jgi:predicted dehydrogenase